MSHDHQITPEPYITVKEAARLAGRKDWHIRRAIKAGLIPTYTAFSGRCLVKLSEVIAAIEATRTGGAK